MLGARSAGGMNSIMESHLTNAANLFYDWGPPQPKVPAAVVQVPKRGFRFPFQCWLSSGIGRFVVDVAAVNPSSARERYQRWTLAMFEAAARNCR